MISPIIWILIFFAVLLFISVLVYVLVVKFFYWGDKSAPRKKETNQPES